MTQTTSRNIRIRIRHWVLCQLVMARRREVARCYVMLDRAKASLESAHRPLRVLESENMWLINERGAETHADTKATGRNLFEKDRADIAEECGLPPER